MGALASSFHCYIFFILFLIFLYFFEEIKKCELGNNPKMGYDIGNLWIVGEFVGNKYINGCTNR
jgi:hypothetical protein